MLNGLAVADEDVVQLDPTTGLYTMVFDGSDVGVTGDIDAFEKLPDGSLLLSLDADTSLPGFGAVDDSDILRFVPTSLGPDTAGTLGWYFDGSDVGLTTTNEDVDTIGFLFDGRLLISTIGAVKVTGAAGDDEDLLAFTPATLGSNTSGTWAFYFDGSDVGLADSSSEDVNALWVAANGDLYLSTVGNFAVDGAAGANEDIFVFWPATLGPVTTGAYLPDLYLDGSLYGLASFALDAMFVVP